MEWMLLGEVAPYGVTGVVAWMWLSERRGSAERDRQLTAAHERLIEQRVQLGALMRLVRENTRAMAALEAGQRQLGRALRAVARGGRVEGGGGRRVGER